MTPEFDIANDSTLVTRWVYANKETVDWLLSINTRNRKKKDHQIKTLVNRIKTGQWRDVGDSIAVSDSGFLLNGQNRLEAIKQAGYPRVRFLLTTGMPDETLEATDQLSPRTTRDVMQLLLDTKVSGRMIACLNWLFYIKSRQTHSSTINQTKPSPVMLLNWIEQHNELLIEFMEVIKTQRNTVSASIIEYAFRNKKKAVEFARQIVYGDNLSIDDPAYRLREYLNSIKGGGACIQRECYEKTVAAILKHVRGAKCKQLNYPPKGWDDFDKR